MDQIEEKLLYSILDRIAVCFESIARSMAGLDETAKKAYDRQFPEQHPPTEAILSRVQSEEDRILESQGASDRRPIREWLGGLPIDDPNEEIGTREREFLERQKAKERDASSEVGKVEGQGGSGVEASRSEAGKVSVDSPSERNDKAGRKGSRRPKGRP